MSKRTRLLALTIVSSFVLVGSAALFFVEDLRPSIESSARAAHVGGQPDAVRYDGITAQDAPLGNLYGLAPTWHAGRLHAPPDDWIAGELRGSGALPPDASADAIARAVDGWLEANALSSRDWWDVQDTARLASIERQALEQAPAVAKPVTAHVLVIPVEFAGTDELTHQVQDGMQQCVTVTRRFTGPLHGAIPYPGGSVTSTIDNQTLYYPRTEPEDYARLIFGRDGYTDPVRPGDPNLNDGAGVDISGLTVQTYFDAQSDHTVTITGTVAPWVQNGHSEAFYGIDRCISNMPARALPDDQIGQMGDLAVAAAEALKATGGLYATHAFWKRFDGDDDGTIDAFWLIHAGRGQEYGGGSEGEEAIWSRANHVGSYDGYEAAGYVIHDNDTPDPADDVRIGQFNQLPEDSDIGVLIEEFTHSTFGLPDLYTNDASNSVGWWAPLSSGIWGGELGGTQPVNMPLWFRMVAECDGTPCGWADPIKTIGDSNEGEVVVLGQAGTPAGGTVEGGPLDGETIYEGVRIDLPEQSQVVANQVGEGGGAYSGAEIGQPNVLERAIDLTDVATPTVLSFDALWRIRAHAGFAHVMVSTDGDNYVTLPDMDGNTTNQNRFGINRGHGLTGEGRTRLRYDLSAYAGRVIQLAFLFQDWLGPSEGWWIDNVQIAEVLDEQFDDGFEGWTNMGWQHVPRTLHFPHYYLIEWRNSNGFDQSLANAYVTNFNDGEQWRVDRVSANLPAAVVWYRNMKYDGSSSLLSAENDAPSIGPKYRLLVVDTNYWPTQRQSGRGFPNSVESLDGGLARGRQPDFTLEVRDPTTGQLLSVDQITGTNGVSEFDDAQGYVPGFRLKANPDTGDMVPTPLSRNASVVIPSLDGKLYSTRITGAGGSRPHSLDGQPVGATAHVFGSGNPGDANLQMGVRVELLDQADDGSWGAVRVRYEMNYKVLADSTRWEPSGSYAVSHTIRNRRSITTTTLITYSVKAPNATEFAQASTSESLVAPGESVHELGLRLNVPATVEFDPSFDSHYYVRAEFNDGDNVFTRDVALDPPWLIYLPTAKRE